MYAFNTDNSILKVPELETKNSFLTVDSGLWQVIGDLDQTIFVQQIWYWFSNPDNGQKFQDGQRWIWKSIKEFKAEVFPGWSETKIRKVRDDLCDRELLLRDNKFSEHYESRRFCKNRTLYYRLNLDKLERLITSVIGGQENSQENARTIETVRSAYVCEPVPRLSVEHNKEYITEKTKEKNNIEAQTEFENSLEDQIEENLDNQSSVLETIKPPTAFASNLESTNKQEQKDQSRAFHENNNPPPLVKNCNEEGGLSKTMLNKPEIKKKEVLSSKSDNSQLNPNGLNKAVKLKTRKMYSNYNNPGGIAPNDDSSNPELKGRRYNHQKGSYSSRANDPWMESRNAIDAGFVDWLYKTREQQGQDCGLANLKAEIRNNYVRAGDLWQDYLAASDKKTSKSQAKFGSPRHEITAESMDSWVEATRARINNKNNAEEDSVDWESKLAEKAEILRQRQECQSLVEKERTLAEGKTQSDLAAKQLSAREIDLSKIKQLEELRLKHPELNLDVEINKIKQRLKQNAQDQKKSYP